MATPAAERFHARVVDEHVDELGFLLHLRASRLPFSPGDVREWLAFDRRIAAHLDGLLLRAPMAWARLAPTTRARPNAAALRLSGALALNSGDEAMVDHWLALAAGDGAQAPPADEITRWILPELLRPLLGLLEDDGLGADLTLALAIEVADRLQAQAAVWERLAERVMARHEAAPLCARAVVRVGAPAATTALALLHRHARQAAIRLAAGCAPASVSVQPGGAATDTCALHEIAVFGPAATMRAALRLAPHALPAELKALVERGEHLACACAVAAVGQPRWLSLLQPPHAASRQTDAAAIAMLRETVAGSNASADGGCEWQPGQMDQATLHGQPRDLAACLNVLRLGECAERMVCAEVLPATLPGSSSIDVFAPMWEQLRHPALSKPKSTAPAPEH